jgi:hypothetical protein
MNYIAKVLEQKPTKPGCWNYLQVGVFEVADDGTEKQVGSYERKYSSMYDTFFAFKQKGKWYALYSSDYTCTSVMSLPDCKMIATEKGDAYGFCPTGYYVPDAETLSQSNLRALMTKEGKLDEFIKGFRSEEHYADMEKRHGKETADRMRENDKEEDEAWDKLEENTVGQFGFISGCVWGDDSSWKLEYLDLSKITEGIINRYPRWGYWELPNGKKLKECLDFEYFEPDGFTQLKALKEETIAVLDRNWHDYKVGDERTFRADSVFNGLRVKIKEIQQDDVLCEVLSSNNEVKEKEIWFPGYFFDKYAEKPPKGEKQ